MLRSLILYLYIVLIIINNLTNTAKDPFLEVLLPERMYKHYKLNEKTGYLEKLIAPISHLVEMISSDAEDGTTTTTILDALPQSIDQLISPVGHSKLFSGIPVESMPPKHYMHYLWLHETSRPIVLPCWTPYKQEVINWYETNSDMEITRTWFIGQGPSEFWSVATASGYSVDPASGALFISPFQGLSYRHSQFSCVIKWKETKTSSLKLHHITFVESHSIAYQFIRDHPFHVDRNDLSTATIRFDFSAINPFVPICGTYSKDEYMRTCRDSIWANQKLDLIQNQLTDHFDLSKWMDFESVYQLFNISIMKSISDFCHQYNCKIKSGIKETTQETDIAISKINISLLTKPEKPVVSTTTTTEFVVDDDEDEEIITQTTNPENASNTLTTPPTPAPPPAPPTETAEKPSVQDDKTPHTENESLAPGESIPEKPVSQSKIIIHKAEVEDESAVLSTPPLPVPAPPAEGIPMTGENLTTTTGGMNDTQPPITPTNDTATKTGELLDDSGRNQTVTESPQNNQSDVVSVITGETKLITMKKIHLQVELEFTNPLIDCDMIKGIVEPDLGDMDLKQFQFSFDNEPFSPLSNSLYKYHSVAVKSRTPMYSEVYSPMICINSSTTPRRYDQSIEALKVDSGFTVVFNVPQVEQSAEIQFTDGTGCFIKLDCNQSLCDIRFNLDGFADRLIFTYNKRAYYNLLKTEPDLLETSDRVIYTLVGETVTHYDERIHQKNAGSTQRIHLYKYHTRLGEYEKTFESFESSHRCQSRQLSLNSSTDDVTARIMSWTSDEIIGPSFEKTKRFIDHMLQPCGYEETVSVRNREATTVNASGTNITNTTVNNISSNSTTSNATISNTTTTTTTVSSMNDENNKRPSLSASSYVTSEYQLPYHPTFILPRYPANDKPYRQYYSLRGRLCSTPCDPSDGILKCQTTQTVEACNTEFWTDIDGSYIRKCNVSSIQPHYCALASQYCDQPSDKMSRLSAEEIITEVDDVCSFTGAIHSHSHTMECTKKKSLIDMRSLLEPDAKSDCTMIQIDNDPDIQYKVDPIYIQMKPVMKTCKEKHTKAMTTDQIYTERITYSPRFCPLGTYHTDDNKRECIPCPPDTYADIQTSNHECEPCPMNRPSTFSIEGSVSSQCSNELIGKLQRKFFDYKNETGNEILSFDFAWSPSLIQQRLYNETLDWLAPKPEFLEKQRQAVAAFRRMTQITFSSNELALIIILSIPIAIFGGTLFMVIIFGLSRRIKCPIDNQMDTIKEKLSDKKPLLIIEQIAHKLFCAVIKFPLLVSSLMSRLISRIIEELGDLPYKIKHSQLFKSFQQNLKSLQVAVSKQVYHRPTFILTDNFNHLVHTLTDIMINRITETALNDLNYQRKQRLSIEHKLKQHIEAYNQAKQKADSAQTALKTLESEYQLASKQFNRQINDETVSKKELPSIITDYEQKLAKASNLIETTQQEVSQKRRELAQAEMKLLSESPISESAEHLIFNEDEKSIYYAAPELRAYLRLPRHYNDAFFLLHPKSKINEMKRRSRHEAPPRP